VCVLTTVIGAVDHGYRVIVVVTDAVCSSSDEGHDAMLKLYRERYSLQIEAVGFEAILSAWSARWGRQNSLLKLAGTRGPTARC
jgi:nicotinamidase-related amidase